MKLLVVTPAAAGSLTGNRVTAERWGRLLRELGHEVELIESWAGEDCDLLVALHARRSAESIARIHQQRPQVPSIVVLTGTDLYADLASSPEARISLERADLLIGLHAKAAEAVPPALRSKVRVVYQSAEPVAQTRQKSEAAFEVCLLAHLREVKDPLLAARAARRLPATSRITVVHAGAALEEEWRRAATREAEGNPRYRWLGPLPQDRALALLARCRLLLVTSRLEGGANVVSEAVVHGVPVLSTRIAGSEGILGEDYPGLFPVGDEGALAALLHRAETDRVFYHRLAARCAGLRPLLAPERERVAWRDLLAELTAES